MAVRENSYVVALHYLGDDVHQYAVDVSLCGLAIERLVEFYLQLAVQVRCHFNAFILSYWRSTSLSTSTTSSVSR